MKKKQLSTLIVLYLILGPVNWIPGFSPAFVSNIKYGLFAVILLSCLPGGKVRFSRPLDFNLLLITALACIPAVVNSSGIILYNLLDFLMIFLVSIIVAGSPFSQLEWLKIFYKSAIGFSVLSIILIFLPFVGLNYPAPEPWEQSSIKLCGLGGYRTGWSNSIFLFVPFLAYLSLAANDSKKQIYFLLAVGAIVTLQFMAGGRAGLLASLLSILFMYRKKMKFFLFFLTAGISAFFLIGREQLASTLRYDEKLIRNKRGTSDLDKISSGRIEGYTVAWKMIIENPVIGFGFNKTQEELSMRGISVDIHNTYLKRWLEGGLFLFLMIIAILYSVQAAFRKRTEHLGYYFRSYGTLFVFFPMLLANGEPNYLFGSFQGESFYWFMILALIHKPAETIKAPTFYNTRLKSNPDSKAENTPDS